MLRIAAIVSRVKYENASGKANKVMPLGRSNRDRALIKGGTQR